MHITAYDQRFASTDSIAVYGPPNKPQKPQPRPPNSPPDKPKANEAGHAVSDSCMTCAVDYAPPNKPMVPSKPKPTPGQPAPSPKNKLDADFPPICQNNPPDDGKPDKPMTPKPPKPTNPKKREAVVASNKTEYGGADKPVIAGKPARPSTGDKPTTKSVLQEIVGLPLWFAPESRIMHQLAANKTWSMLMMLNAHLFF